jgi:hypothetical protein
MAKIYFAPISEEAIVSSIQQLSLQCGKLKASLVRRILMDKSINRKDVQLFESFINSFLKYWTERAENLRDTLHQVKEIKSSSELSSLDYDYVKSFIYASYDYASVLQFTDGLLRGIESEKIRKPDDIEDFKNHTISMAFDDNDPSVGGLLDSVIGERTGGMNNVPVDALGLKNFYNIRNYNGLLKKTDRTEIYKAVTKVINYLLDNEVLDEELDHIHANLYIHMLNSIVDYVTYTLAAYACRTFIICQYASPFISRYQMEYNRDNKEIKEAADITISDIPENPTGTISNEFHAMDELIVKDPDKNKEFFDKFADFMKIIGADTLFGDHFPTYNQQFYSRTKLSSGKLYQRLNDNTLSHFLTNFGMMGYRTKYSEVSELHQNLKDQVFNNHLGLSGTSSPRNELIAIIRDTTYGETVKDYKELAKDLYILSMHMNHSISNAMARLNELIMPELETNRSSISVSKLMNECTKFLIDLYEEFMFAVYQKALYIERKINDLRDGELKKAIGGVSLSIKGSKSDVTLAAYTGLSVPHTVAGSEKDLYTQPVFEAYDLYSEYLHSLPMFENDFYFSEAGGAKIIDMIFAALKAIIEKVQNAWQNGKFVLAKKWIVGHENELLQMTFPATVDMNILPYKPNIQLPVGFDKFPAGLKSFSEKSLDDLEKYAESLYPNPTVAGWFKDNPETAPQRYHNSILFDDGSDKPVQEVSVKTGDNLKKLLPQWIETVKGTDATLEGFKKIQGDIQSALNNIKAIVVRSEGAVNNAQPNQNAGQPQANNAPGTAAAGNNPAGTTPPPVAAGAKPQNESVLTEADTNAANGTNNADSGTPKRSIQDATATIQKAIQRLWLPVGQVIIQASFIQYGYIKTAYSLGKTNTATPTAPTQGSLT